MQPRSREIARGVAEIREDRARCSRRVAVWSLSATPRPVLGEMSACALIKARDYAGLECYVAARADVSAADHSGTVPSEHLASSRVISRHLASCRCTLRHHAAARCSRGRRRARDGERAAAGGRQAEVTRDDRDDSSLGDAAVGGRQPRGHRQVGPHAMARGERRGGGRRKGGGRRGRADPWRRGAARRPRRCGDHAAAARAAAAGRAHQLGGTAASAAHGGVGAVRCRADLQRRWRGAKGRGFLREWPPQKRKAYVTVSRRGGMVSNSFSGGRSTGRRGRSGGGVGVASELARKSHSTSDPLHRTRTTTLRQHRTSLEKETRSAARLKNRRRARRMTGTRTRRSHGIACRRPWGSPRSSGQLGCLGTGLLHCC